MGRHRDGRSAGRDRMARASRRPTATRSRSDRVASRSDGAISARLARRVSAASWDAPVLVLEAATCRASVAVVLETRVLGEAEAMVRAEPEDRLMPAVAAALRAAGGPPAGFAGL